jgi:hypothetical protein
MLLIVFWSLFLMAKFGETPTQPKQIEEASLEPKSLGNALIDVSDDDQDEALVKLNKDKL